MGRFLRFGCLGLVGLIALIVVIGLVSGPRSSSPTASPTLSASAPPATAAASVATVGAPAPTSTTASAAAAKPAAPATAIPAPTTASALKPVADGNRGIIFGKPALLSAGGLNTVAVPVSNTTDQVKSFTVKATFKTGDTIAGTASGAVNDILPGQKRVASLLSQEKIPTNYDSVRVDVDTMVREAKSTTGADVASKITFGKPSVKGGPLATMDVEVTNGDTAPHSFTVQAGFYKGEDVVGLASGAVNDIAPGQTKTASLLIQGTTSGADTTQVALDTVVK